MIPTSWRSLSILVSQLLFNLSEKTTKARIVFGHSIIIHPNAVTVEFQSVISSRCQRSFQKADIDHETSFLFNYMYVDWAEDFTFSLYYIFNKYSASNALGLIIVP